MTLIDKAKILLRDLLASSNVDAGHGIDHSLIVLEHADRALECEDLADETKTAIRLAALLHDADDAKFFSTSDNENLIKILDQLYPQHSIEKELIVQMVGLVSCRKNLNKPANVEWMLIPRHADRLEALGEIGIVRCWQYTLHKQRPLYLPTTPRATTVKELNDIATRERFENYTGVSASMMDHFYDKVLHLKNMPTTNPYFLQEGERRHQQIVDYCLQFGKNGVIDEDWLREKSKYH